MSLLSIFDVAGSAMSAQTVRLNTTASNIANADSVSSNFDETYRARHPVFAARLAASIGDGSGLETNDEEAGAAGVNVLGIVESEAPLKMRYEPEHPLADDNGYVAYPNVNVVQEMTDMISATRAFQLNVEVMNSARTLAERLLTLGQ
jgi:flagellar basal-body rod protein FlgC